MPGAASGLMRLGRLAASEREAALERCELCGASIPDDHRHVLELERRTVLCACRPCSILFDRADGHLRLIGDRRLTITDLDLSDLMWEELRLPVEVAFFVNRQAFYPSPMGPTESLLALEAWEALEAANPILRTLRPHVEALLVNRVRGARQAWIVPIDECFALVGLIRTRWRGLTGGSEVWKELAGFYEQLDRRARPASRNDERT